MLSYANAKSSPRSLAVKTEEYQAATKAFEPYLQYRADDAAAGWAREDQEPLGATFLDELADGRQLTERVETTDWGTFETPDGKVDVLVTIRLRPHGRKFQPHPFAT